MNPITDELLEQYQRDGYCVVRELLDPASLERWKTRLSAIADGEVAPAERMLVMKDVMVARGAVEVGSKLEAVAKIQDYENDPELWSYVDDDRLLDCVERFIGKSVFTLHTMLINKPPNVDGRHPLHQDLLYFPFRPADRIVATWTALEPVTRENGCLVVVPGSHEGELLPHENMDWEHVNAAYWGAKGVGGDAPRVHLEMEPGDTVFFHPILIHGSGRNRTQGFRRAISAHYASTDCVWAWNTDAVLQRPYKVVRGEGAGGPWSGPVASEGRINPLDYVPVDRPVAPGRSD
ncbi:MAG: phytanoyl-CoA dioxygenase family protein [Myxococcota bacterium]|nr:phytanoyl-CoA dioxygenase family protein [Myxococcota bacterium]